jgi:hypothetical protein
MPLKVIVGTATKDTARMEAYPATTAKRATRIEAWDGSAWKVAQSFAPTMSLSVTPEVSGSSGSPSGGVITSAAAFATPTGGTGPYTYAWTIVSGNALTVNTPNSANTSFRSSVGPGNSKFAVYRCTCTDSLGTTADDTVNVTLTNTSEA